MVEQVTLTEVLGSLRDELGSLHLRVPCRSGVDRDFQSIGLSGVSRILKCGV